ncbi:MAG TPA: OmpA family protein [Vicinamibacterales bacterium]|nr:OmpA family protein [Vicinamibacterales bacterium]
MAQDSRPGSSTVVGDTGLWFVPLAETLPKGGFTFGAQRMALNRSEGFANIADIGGMFAFGATDRIEIFGSMGFRRIDADLRPVTYLGQPQDYLINQGWSTGAGDATVGAKFNLRSQTLDNGVAFALRVAAKLPTASRDDGLGTGKADAWFDLIASREFSEKVDLTASAGMKFRGSPEGYNLTKGFIWGIGMGYPSRSKLKLIAEMNGEAYFNLDQFFTGAQSATTPPSQWLADATREIFGGLQYQADNGFFVGGGANLAASHLHHRSDNNVADKGGADKVDFQVRLGYRPSGIRNYAAAPTTVKPTAPPTPALPPNRAPTVKARCEPCTVEINRQLTASADAQDPDGDTLRYRWTSPTGTFGSANDRQTPWTAPGQPGAVPLTITVDDGKGLTATDTVTVQVVAPAPKRQITFEDVHFDFDRYSLRPEAARILDEAIKAMQDDPNLRFTIEGHTCNIGTTEYNLALGERRSTAVRDYLVGRGVNASRLQTVSYGEERPKHDNGREETRRLNRRAALTMRLQ